MWYSRRDARVRKPVTQLTARQASTSPFLAPDAQLYYKAKNSRPKDEMDFTAALPILTSDERGWLSQAIILTYGESHAWLPRIGNCSR